MIFRCHSQSANADQIIVVKANDITRSKWPSSTVSEVMRPFKDLHTVAPQVSVTKVLEIMSREDLNQLPVIKDDRLEGIISRSTSFACCSRERSFKHELYSSAKELRLIVCFVNKRISFTMFFQHRSRYAI